MHFLEGFLENAPNIKFHEKIAQWEPSCSMRPAVRKDGQTDRYDERKRAWKMLCDRGR